MEHSYAPPFDLTKPVFPNLLKVVQSPLDFSSKLILLKPVCGGEVICDMQGNAIVPQKAWTTVQIGINPESHIELNSELVYMNHSCNPSVRLDCKSRCLVALHNLNPGDEITFFYPSTEWSMAKPFDCWCCRGNLNDRDDLETMSTTLSNVTSTRKYKCCQLISGAKDLTLAQRQEFKALFEPHILEMLAQSS